MNDTLLSVSGISALIGTGNLADVQRTRCVDICLNIFPYSILIFGIGGIVILVACILQIVDIILSNRHDISDLQPYHGPYDQAMRKQEFKRVIDTRPNSMLHGQQVQVATSKNAW